MRDKSDAAAKNSGGIMTEIMTAVGKIKLFTELPPCSSCSSVIAQFTEKYPNIIIEVIDNGGKQLTP